MGKGLRGKKELYDFYKGLDRSFFVDNKHKVISSLDRALPIGYGQTISQPSLVYSMTSRLELNKNLRVLEIGTGSGYQTTLLAEYSKEVYTVELIEELSLKAQERLKKLGYKNVFYKIGDGSNGWANYMPYDRIIVTAAASEIPDSLIEQLTLGGRMIIPVGERSMQNIMIIDKKKNGEINIQKFESVLFVEFKGRYGWNL